MESSGLSSQRFRKAWPVLLSPLVVQLLLGGCQTTTVDQGTDYKIEEGNATSVLDAQLKKLNEDLEKYPKRSDLRYQMAAIHYQKANYRESAKELEEAIHLSPEEMKYHYHLGRVYLYMQELSLAEKQFRQATKLSSQDRYTGPHAALGYVLAVEKRPDEALAEFKRCAELEPENPIYYYFLGMLYDMKGSPKETIHYFQEYLVLGGKTYRQKACFVLEKLGVRVQDLPPPKQSPETEELFGSGFGGGAERAKDEPIFERAPPEESLPKKDTSTAPEKK